MAVLWTGNPQHPTPGSPWSAGCLCDKVSNNKGRGMSGLADQYGRPVFNVHPSCPNHDETVDVGAYPTNAATIVPQPS